MEMARLSLSWPGTRCGNFDRFHKSVSSSRKVQNYHTEFHEYAVERTGNQIQYAIDGNVVGAFSETRNRFTLSKSAFFLPLGIVPVAWAFATLRFANGPLVASLLPDGGSRPQVSPANAIYIMSPEGAWAASDLPAWRGGKWASGRCVEVMASVIRPLVIRPTGEAVTRLSESLRRQAAKDIFRTLRLITSRQKALGFARWLQVTKEEYQGETAAFTLLTRLDSYDRLVHKRSRVGALLASAMAMEGKRVDMSERQVTSHPSMRTFCGSLARQMAREGWHQAVGARPVSLLSRGSKNHHRGQCNPCRNFFTASQLKDEVSSEK
eukprot:s3471_g1.t2